jgi:hypothetical protein
MANPVLKAKKAVQFAGTTSNQVIALNSGWNTTFGSATYTPVEGDLVVVSFSTGSAADRSIGVVTAGYTEEAELYANNAIDTSLSVSHKVMGATPDTSVTTTGSMSTADAGTIIVEVWGNVDPATSMDVTRTTATGTGVGRPDPPAITPVTSGARILVVGAAADGTGAVFTQPGAELSNFLSAAQADNNDAMIGTGDVAWSGAGAFDPVAWTGGSATGSWAAVTLALRPLVLTPDSAAHGHSSTQPTLAAKSALTPNGASHGHSATEPSITAFSTPVAEPADALHAHASTQPTLAAKSTLTPDAAAHGHSSTQPTLAAKSTVVPANSLHDHSATGPALVAHAVLAPFAAIHAHEASSPTLTVPAIPIEPDDSYHGAPAVGGGSGVKVTAFFFRG